MNKKIILILGIMAVILISGCVQKQCEIASDCVSKTCFEVKCKDHNCVYSPISNCCGNKICEVGETYSECVADCPNCDDKNNCTVDEYDYHEEKCMNKLTTDVVCCGNERCEKGEIYENCVKDCPNCDDKNDCSHDYYEYHKQECINDPIIPCCGNEICDENVETFSSCSEDCPNCDDNNKLTSDNFNYAVQVCENIVTHYFIDDFEEGTGSWVMSGDGEWSTTIENGNTVLKLGHNQANLQEEWNNYAFKFRFKRIEGSMHANFRHSSTKEEWNRYFVGVSGNGVNSLRKQVGDDFQTLAQIKSAFDDNWHTLEIRCYEDVVNVYFDDTLLNKYRDTENPLLSGKVGIEIHTGGEQITPEFLIDNVEIKAISEEDIISP